jgi:2-polyprenyl-3-methyl-5-hydroxy-6-metoxy-1,4-benzoquinol methylase
MKATNRIYDAFVRYDRADLKLVEYIVRGLGDHGLHIWFDRWSMLNVRTPQREMEDGLSSSRSIVWCVGNRDPLLRQDRLDFEILPVTVVLLPGANKRVRSLPSFLVDVAYIDFSDDLTAPKKLAELLTRIVGLRSAACEDARIVGPGNVPLDLSITASLTGRTIKAYDAIAEKFTETWFDHPPLQALELLNEHLPGPCTILDAGCGPGHHSRFFMKKGHEVTGIDLSSEMVRIAEAKTKGIVYRHMDMRSLTFPSRSFDAVWCAGSIIHVPKESLGAQLFEFKKVLKPSGVLGLNLQIARKSEIAADGRFFEFYGSREEITRLVKIAGFEIVNEDYGETVRNTHELDLTLKWLTLYCRPAQESRGRTI